MIASPRGMFQGGTLSVKMGVLWEAIEFKEEVK